MKKKIIGIFTCLLALVFFVSVLAACEPAPEQGGGDEETPVVEPADTNLIESGVSDYSIVIPASPQSCEQFAASELSNFLYDATGVRLPTVSDTSVTAASGKYISLGATSLREELAPAFDESELGYSGFRIVTEGDDVLISGANDNRSYGTLYGVYDFLSYTIGLEIYAGDAIVWNEYRAGDSVPLYDLNYTSVPDIQLMGMGSATLTQDRTYMRRMRLTSFYSSDYCMGSVHSTAGFFMNPSNYTDHPDWFWTEAAQTGICWSNDGVVDAIAQEIISRTENSDARYIFITQPDTESYGCTCAECKANLPKYETASGLQLYFINRVADKVKAYYDETDPDKDLTLVVFAYRFTLSAPSAATMQAYPELAPKSNVAVSFIPISMNFEYPITAPENASFYQSMQEWSQIFHQQRLVIYTYGTGFHCFFDVFNDFGSIKGSLEAYHELGVELINEQANMESAMGCFEELRIYLNSKLAWDTDRNVDELIADFFANYYGAASDTMLEYFNAITALTSATFRANNLSTGIYITLYDKAGFGSVNSLRNLLDRAEEDILYLQSADPEQYETMLDRIKKEKLTVYFSLLATHSSRMDAADYAAVKEEFTRYCAKFNIIRWRENVSVETFLEGLA